MPLRPWLNFKIMNAVFSILVQDEIKTHGHMNWRAKSTISSTKLLICKLAALVASM